MMKDRLFALFLLGLLLLVRPVSASEGMRHLKDLEGNPLFIRSMTVWTLSSDYTEAEVRELLTKVQQMGYNTILMSAVFGEIDHDIYQQAFRKDDILKPNKRYWRKVDHVVKMATEKGLYVVINPIWKRSLNEFIQRQGITKCRKYGQWFARKFVGNPRVMYFIGGDQVPEPVRKEMNAMGEGIQDVYKGKAIVAYHSEGSQSSREAFPDAGWLTFNWTYAYTPAYHFEGKPRYPYEMNYDNVKTFGDLPIQFGEGYYDFGTAKRYNREGVSGRWGNRYVVRRQMWWNFLSGASGIAYGAESVWHKNRDGQTWQQCLDYASCKDMRYLKEVTDSCQWWKLVPDMEHRFLTNCEDKYLTDQYPTAAIANDGSFAIVYTPVSLQLVIHLPDDSHFTLRWYDPSDGTSYPATGYDLKGNTLTIKSPVANHSGAQDMVMMIWK